MMAGRTTAGRFTVFSVLTGAHGLVSMGTSAAVAALLYRHFGAEFGVFALISTGMLRLNLLDDSLGSYVVTTVARLRRGKDEARLTSGSLGAALVAGAAASAVLAVAFGGGLLVLYRDRLDTPALAGLGAAGLFCFSMGSQAGRLLEGAQKYAWLRSLQSGIQLSRLFGIVWLISSCKVGLIGVLALDVATHAAMALGAFGCAHTRVGVRFGSSMRIVQRQHFVRLLRFARPLLIAKGVAVFSYRLDLVVVEVLVGTPATAAYAVAETVYTTLLRAIEAFKVLLPVSVDSWRPDDPSWNARFVLATSKALVFVVGGLCLALWVNLNDVLALWFGDVAPVTLIASRLLLSFVALTTVRSAVQTILIGQNKFSRLERAFLVGGVINTLTSVLATALLGAWGAALGTAVAGVFLVVSVVPAAERALDLPPRMLSRELVVPSLAVLAVCATLGLLTIQPLSAQIPDMVLRTALVAVVFGILFWLVILNRSERTWLLQPLRRSR